MSLANAPEKTFVELVKVLNDFGFKCQANQPVWTCEGKPENYSKLPTLDINLLQKDSSETVTVKMPPPAYMKQDGDSNFLLIAPWQSKGIIGS